MTPPTLPDHPLYAFCPAYEPSAHPQQIRIIFNGVPGYVPTALVALTLDDAERLCDRLNARLGLDRQTWIEIAGRSMFGNPAPHGPDNSAPH